jgi:hypothetical protein
VGKIKTKATRNRYRKRALSLFIVLNVVLVLFVISFVVRKPTQLPINAAPNNTISFDIPSASHVSSFTNLEVFPWVAVDSNNVSHVVFLNETATNLYQLVYTNNAGGGFGTPTILADVQNIGEDSRPIIVFANGSLHMVYTVARKQVFYRRGNINGIWDAPILVNSAVGSAFNGSLVVDPGGTVHLVYIDDRCGSFNVFYKTLSGGVLSPEATPLADCIFRSKVRLAYANGTLHMVFRQVNDIYYTRLTPGGWTPGVNVSNSPATVSFNPNITTNGTALYVAWAEPTNGGGDIFFRYSPDGGQNWAGQLAVSGGPSFAQYPSLAWVPSVNRGYIVWSDTMSGAGGKTDIMFHEFDPAPTNFGNPIALTCMTDGSEWPTISVGGSKAAVVWQDRFGAGGAYYIYHVNGQIGSGQVTSGCVSTPLGGPTAGAPTNTPVPPPPTATPTPRPIPPTAIPTIGPTLTPTIGVPPTLAPGYFDDTATADISETPYIEPQPVHYDTTQIWIIIALVGGMVLVFAHGMF